VGGGMIASPVVMSGFIRVRELFESFPGMPWVEQESMLGGLEHVSWEIVHDETALRGTVLIEKGRELGRVGWIDPIFVVAGSRLVA